VAESAKKHWGSEQTICLWRKRFVQLEQENARHKELVAEREIELEVMKQNNVKTTVGAWARRVQMR
jgi:putative transposase